MEGMAKELRKNKMMKIKTIKKAIAMFSLIAVSVCTFGLSATTNVIAQQTTVTKEAGNAIAPVVLAKWEMYDPQFGPGLIGQLEEDPTTPGAQFDPTGEWNTNMQYMVCAIVTSQTEDLVQTPIRSVYAEIYYPIDRAFHPESSYSPDQLNGGGGTIIDPATPYDYGMSGCGKQRLDENTLYEMSKAEGLALFCDNIRNNDYSLPASYVGTGTVGEAYNLLCGTNGKLQKETAHVYCTPSNDKELKWEDPAGDYKVKVITERDSDFPVYDVVENYFNYGTMTAYEIDFPSVDYGSVLLGIEKKIVGDCGDPDDTTDPTGTFGTADKPTVRNIGNTRLNMGIWQDDMGFSTTNGVPNVSFRARVGNSDLDWTAYYPGEENHVWLEDVLDLSQREEMDFGITVTKFHPVGSEGPWVGAITLDARETAFRQCGAN